MWVIAPVSAAGAPTQDYSALRVGPLLCYYYLLKFGGGNITVLLAGVKRRANDRFKRRSLACIRRLEGTVFDAAMPPKKLLPARSDGPIDKYIHKTKINRDEEPGIARRAAGAAAGRLATHQSAHANGTAASSRAPTPPPSRGEPDDEAYVAGSSAASGRGDEREFDGLEFTPAGGVSYINVDTVVASAALFHGDEAEAEFADAQAPAEVDYGIESDFPSDILNEDYILAGDRAHEAAASSEVGDPSRPTAFSSTMAPSREASGSCSADTSAPASDRTPRPASAGNTGAVRSIVPASEKGLRAPPARAKSLHSGEPQNGSARSQAIQKLLLSEADHLEVLNEDSWEDAMAVKKLKQDAKKPRTESHSRSAGDAQALASPTSRGNTSTKKRQREKAVGPDCVCHRTVVTKEYLAAHPGAALICTHRGTSKGDGPHVFCERCADPNDPKAAKTFAAVFPVVAGEICPKCAMQELDSNRPGVYELLFASDSEVSALHREAAHPGSASVDGRMNGNARSLTAEAQVSSVLGGAGAGKSADSSMIGSNWTDASAATTSTRQSSESPGAKRLRHTGKVEARGLLSPPTLLELTTPSLYPLEELIDGTPVAFPVAVRAPRTLGAAATPPPGSSIRDDALSGPWLPLDSAS